MSRSNVQRLFVLSACAVTPALFSRSAAAATFDDVQYWVGSGSNRAAIVIDWNDGKPAESLVWGFRWEGEASGETMFRAVVNADPRLFAHLSPGGGFGTSIYGAGYDLNADGAFGTSANLTFDAGGLLVGGATHDASTPTDPADHWREGWLSDGYWSYWLGGNGNAPSWTSSNTSMSSRPLTDGAWDGWSYLPNYVGGAPSDPTAAVPEPASFAALGLAAGLLLSHRRRRRPAGMMGAVWLGGIVTVASGGSARAAYKYDANDFAVEVVSSTGLSGSGTYNDSQAVIGRPALQFNDPSGVPTANRRVKLIEAIYNTSPSGEKLITTIDQGQQVTVRMGRRVENDPLNPFGIDLLVFGNAFFSSDAFASDDVNLNTTTLVGGLFSEEMKVSVSQTGEPGTWFTYDAGPYADSLFPTNAYEWDRSAAAWTEQLLDPTKPVDPTLDASDFVGISAADALDLYAGSAGGAGFDLADLGLDWIQYVRVEGAGDFFYGGEIDAFADVRPVPEPAAGVSLVVAIAACGVRRRAPNQP